MGGRRRRATCGARSRGELALGAAVALALAPGALAPTCADADGNDNANDPLVCAAANRALPAEPGDVACAGNPCTASECCTVCADDAVWRFEESVRGTDYTFTCAEFVASVDHGAASCEESWAEGTDAGGDSVTPYVACPVSCPETSTAHGCTAPTQPVTVTCADTNGDGTADDAFSCPAGNRALHQSPSSVTCSGNPCTASR